MPSPVARLSGENTMLVPGPGGPEPHPAAAAAAPDGAAETETYIRCELRSDRLPYGEGRREWPRPPVSGCHYLAFIAGQGGVSGAGPKPGREIQSDYSALVKVGRMAARRRLLHGSSGRI